MTLACLTPYGFQSYFIQIFKNSGIAIAFYQLSFQHHWSTQYGIWWSSLQSIIHLGTWIIRFYSIGHPYLPEIISLAYRGLLHSMCSHAICICFLSFLLNVIRWWFILCFNFPKEAAHGFISLTCFQLIYTFYFYKFIPSVFSQVYLFILCLFVTVYVGC